MIYHLTKFDGVKQSGFLVIPKIKSANLWWNSIHYEKNYSTFNCPLKSDTTFKDCSRGGTYSRSSGGTNYVGG